MIINRAIFRYTSLLLLLGGIIIGIASLNLQGVDASASLYPYDATEKIDPALLRKLSQEAENRPLRLIVALNVEFKADVMAEGGQSAREQRAKIQAAQEKVAQALENRNARVLHNFEYIPFSVVSVDAEALEVLLALPFVSSVEEDVLEAEHLSGSIPLINADDAWASGYTGAGQVIAVLDTGVDKTHPFLAGKVVSEACYSTNDPSYACTSICPGGVTSSTSSGSAMPYAGTCPSGRCDHGTHVAGIAAGKGTSFSGVAKDASLIAIQVFSRFDSSSYCSPASTPCVLSWSSDMVRGLERVYALREQYAIAAVNISIGGGYYAGYCDTAPGNLARKAQIDLLRTAGVATIISSGNDGYTNGIASPACISSAVSVGATSKSDAVASYSNSASILKLLAPGGISSGAIYSSLPVNRYGYMYGTSMASPHVSGAWAVIKSKKPGASVDEVLDALQTSGKPLLDTRNGLIKPRIDVMAALNRFSLFPVAPSGLSAIAAADQDLVDLSWTDNSSDELGFRIERRLTGGNWQSVGTVSANTTAFRDTSPACESAIEYRVLAYNSAGDSGDSNTASLTIPLCLPVDLAAGAVSQQRILVTWSDRSSRELGYRVQRSPNGSSGWQQLGLDLPADSSSLNDYPLSCGTTYYYRIEVFDATLLRTSQVFSRATQSCTAPPVPQNPAALPQSVSSIEVSWADVGDFETSYKIERQRSGDNKWSQVGTTGQDIVVFLDVNLEKNTLYYYRITAANTTGNSAASSVVSARTYSQSYYAPLVLP